MKTVIEMAREAGIIHPEKVDAILERFAELVRADERNATLEEIAKWLEDEKDAPYWAELVRARSKNEDRN
jgi:hypothetical protein